MTQWQKACLACTKPLVCSNANTYVPHNLMCILVCPSQEGLLREMGATDWLRLPSGLCLCSWGNGCPCGAWRKEHLQVAHLTISPKGGTMSGATSFETSRAQSCWAPEKQRACRMGWKNSTPRVLPGLFLLVLPPETP